MKKNAVFSTVFLLLMIGGMITVMLTSSNHVNDQSNDSYPLSKTISVNVPDEMVFAGEKIVFDRYDLHERMDRELNSFTYFHSTTLLLFKRANRIFPIIEPILKQQGLPDDIKYLAVIESSLHPRAVSPANAAGLWQFISSTGKGYGLEITSEVDERYHIEKSTVAAAKYLKSARNQYGSWSAAALSYNGGMGRITSELRNQRVNDALDLWLVEETSRYYFRMLAIKLIFENPKAYGFHIQPQHLYKPVEFKEVRVSSSINNLTDFAKQHGISYAQLKDFNSWLRDTKLLNRSGKTYTILIPTKESLFYDESERVKVHDPRWIR